MRPRPGKPNTVICDFDETAAMENVARLLLEEFAGEREKPIREQYRAGKLSFRLYQEMAFLETRSTISQMAAFVQERATVRPGFHAAVEAAARANATFAIASAGLYFYIHALLEREKRAGLPITAVRATHPESGAPLFRYDYPAGQGGCRGDWAICKCLAVEAARTAGSRVVFVGDGLRSDACAAAKADVVFARARLLQHCRENGIDCTEFDGDLHSLADYLSQ